MRYRGYDFFQTLSLCWYKIFTFLFYPRARLIRLPFRLRNLGYFKYGNGFTTGYANRIDIFEGASLTIGSNVQINDYCHIGCANKVTLEDDVLIASKVFITDHDHDFSNSMLAPIKWPIKASEVRIGKRVWLGENVSILKGVCLGDDCIVGANSVVTKCFPPRSIIAGTPAKLIRKR
jgi:lipopolysaccharide O-acetyltransferase